MSARVSALTALLTVGALPVGAATICVNPSNASCQATIQGGIYAAAAGDTVTVAAGTYFENLVIVQQGLQVVGAGKTTTILDADDPNTGPGIVVSGDGVVIRNLSIQNGVNDSIRVEANDVVISGVRISNARWRSGVSAGAGCGIAGGPGNGDGIFVDDLKTGLHVLGSEIHATACFGISDYGVGGNDAAVISGNVFDGNSAGAVRLSGNGVQVLNNKVSGGLGAWFSGAVPGDSISVFGDWALLSGNTTTDSFGYIRAIGDRFAIQNNKAINSQAIYGDCTSGVPCNGGTISNNTTTSATRLNSGVWSYNSGTGLVMQANKVTSAGLNPLLIYGYSDVAVVTQAIGNVITGSGLPSQPCVIVYNGSGHEITSNTGSGCGGPAFLIMGANVTATGNKALLSYGSGFWVDGAASGASLTDNSASGCLGAGFANASGAVGTTLTGNVASKNRIGFCDEGSGTIDGGGNNFAVAGAPTTCDIQR